MKLGAASMHLVQASFVCAVGVVVVVNLDGYAISFATTSWSYLQHAFNFGTWPS